VRVYCTEMLAVGVRSAVVVAALCGVFVFVGAAGCEKKVSVASDPAAARALFASACARCHGAEGTGGLPLFTGGPSPRNFRDAAFQREHTDEQIRMAIVNGKGPGMPPFGTTFTDAQLTALVTHVRSLAPERSTP
jgi:mono/diheme cytochrome c family protein